MKDLAKKVAVGLATSALLVQSLVLPVFGEITVVVSGNGADTNNGVSVGQSTVTTVTQSNVANISNDIKAEASTGDNEAKENTGGAVSIDTGDAKATVDVTNTANSNEAVVGCGGCTPDVNVEVSGNGADSTNGVKLELANTTWVAQANYAHLDNDVEVEAETGDNDAEENTGGEVSIETGDATAKATVVNQANANVAMVSGDDAGALSLLITGNGAESVNTILVGLENTLGVDQFNWAHLDNDVEVEAETGDNEAKENTGGAVSIDTGDAYASALVDNMVNFNWANVEDCCEFDGLVKVAGNGVDSENGVELALVSGLYAGQYNDYSCHGYPFPGGLLGDFGFPFFKKHDCNEVDVEAETGDNEVEESTGQPTDDPTIETGNATSEVSVENAGNSNVFSTGEALPSPSPDFDWDDFDMGGMNWLVWLLFGWLS